MRVGFTGTQLGMVPIQVRILTEFLEEIAGDMSEFHHGDCVGADRQAHDIVRRVAPRCLIHGHPPLDPKKRAFCGFDRCEDPKPYLVRNRRIVDFTSYLVGAPGQVREIVRSGTRSTIRYARTLERPMLIVLPSRKET